MEDENTRYEAVRSRDGRFDGESFFAVETTGIHCRPSCPAVTPKRENVRFYATAAAAQGAGFRACRRCRPDAVPGSAEWNVRADAVGRAMRLIGDRTWRQRVRTSRTPGGRGGRTPSNASGRQTSRSKESCREYHEDLHHRQ